MGIGTKMIGSGASIAAKSSWLSKIFTGTKGLLSGAGKFFANPWVTAALLAWDLYDTFDDDSEGGEVDPATLIADGGRSRDLIRIMYPPSIIRTLRTSISDSAAMSLVFTSAFLKASNTSDPLARMRAPFYACMADYLVQSPDVNVIIYTPTKTAELLDDISDVMAFQEDATAKEQIEGLKLSASDIASAPLEVRRLLDFTAHFITNFKQEIDNE